MMSSAFYEAVGFKPQPMPRVQKTMKQNLLQCDQERCELLADDFFSNVHGMTRQSRFNNVLADIVKTYPDAILVGAIAAAKYVRSPVEPRMTFDVDILLPEADFDAFLADEIPAPTRTILDALFEDSDSPMHSMKHRQTGIYVDFLSVQSKPVKKKLIRHILDNPKQTTHLLQAGKRKIRIITPDILIAMKLCRYNKNPNSEKGLSDRLDLIKILKTLDVNCIAEDLSGVRSLLTRAELKRFEQIRQGVESEMACEETF